MKKVISHHRPLQICHKDKVEKRKILGNIWKYKFQISGMWRIYPIIIISILSENSKLNLRIKWINRFTKILQISEPLYWKSFKLKECLYTVSMLGKRTKDCFEYFIKDLLKIMGVDVLTNLKYKTQGNLCLL